MLPLALSAISDPDDRSFMESLYIDYSRLMYSEIYKIIGEDQTSEDILQESLIKLADKISLLSSLDRPRKINYIITTVKNMSRNYLRKQNGVSICSLNDEDSNIAYTISSESNVEDSIILYYEKHNFEKTWTKLDETSRTLLEGKYILEMNNAELGEILGVKPSSIRMMLTRARRKALKLMKENHLLHL